MFIPFWRRGVVTSNSAGLAITAQELLSTEAIDPRRPGAGPFGEHVEKRAVSCGDPPTEAPDRYAIVDP